MSSSLESNLFQPYPCKGCKYQYIFDDICRQNLHTAFFVAIFIVQGHSGRFWSEKWPN